MSRKTPQQQIEDARAAIKLARARQRKEDIRVKIAFGELVLAATRNDFTIAEKLLGYLDKCPMKGQEAEMLSAIFEELSSAVLQANVADMGKIQIDQE